MRIPRAYASGGHRLLSLGWLAAFTVLTVLVALGIFDKLDHAIWTRTLQHWHPKLWNGAQNLTGMLSPPVDAGCLAIGTFLLTWRRRRREDVFAVAAVGLVAAAVTLVMKPALGRDGPTGLDATSHGGSYPSGHTLATLVCFGALALLIASSRPALRLPLLAAVALVTVVVMGSLIYIQAHWTTDTIGSLLLGVALLSELDRRLQPHRRPVQPANGVTTGTNLAETLAP